MQLFYWTCSATILVESIWRIYLPSLAHIDCASLAMVMALQSPDSIRNPIHDMKRVQLWRRGIERCMNPFIDHAPCHELSDLCAFLCISISLVGNYEHIILQNALALHGHAILITLPVELNEKQSSLDHPLELKENGCPPNT